jgi:hypothetical protein
MYLRQGHDQPDGHDRFAGRILDMRALQSGYKFVGFHETLNFAL